MPFQRCCECNGLIQTVEKAEIIDRLQPKTKLYYEEFHSCSNCNKLYWEGSHFDRLRPGVEAIINARKK